MLTKENGHNTVRFHTISCTQSFHRHREGAEAPDKTLHQAMVKIQGEKVILTGSSPINQIIATTDPMTALQTQPFYQMWNWEVIVVGNLSNLAADILAGEGYVVSNGSFQLGKGAAAWIVKGHMPT